MVSPVLIFSSIFLGTFISEDASLLSAAALWVQNRGDFWPLFLGSFFGISLGDLGIYFLAYYFGELALSQKWAQRWLRADQREHMKDFYRQQGIWLILAARLMPGTRVVTYLGAGLTKFPPWRFIVTVVISSLVWVVLNFSLLNIIGHQTYLVLTLTCGLICIFILRCLVRWILQGFKPYVWKLRVLGWKRLRYFEFWPPLLFYLPVVFIYLRLVLKYGEILLPSASNPSIDTGGLIGESKTQILHLVDPQHPGMLKFFSHEGVQKNESPEQLLIRIERLEKEIYFQGWDYPFILKPDMGQRGSGVCLIRNRAQLEDYLSKAQFPFLVQEYCFYPYEAGIFYYRFPNEITGHLFSITEKIFPEVIGDGKHTLAQLIMKHPRHCYMAQVFFKRHQNQLEEILSIGDRFRLVEAGNHCQGTVFLNGSRWETPALLQSIDILAKTMNGFYIGRFDLRFKDEESFVQGKNFKIIEINGAGAEATHIYDPKISLMKAYRILNEQWTLLFQLGKINGESGYKPTSIREFLKKVWAYWKLAQYHPPTT